MPIVSIGSISIGLVWGWLLILVGGRGRSKRPWLNALALFLATTAFALTIWQLVQQPIMILYFLIATALSLSAHLILRQSIQP